MAKSELQAKKEKKRKVVKCLNKPTFRKYLFYLKLKNLPLKRPLFHGKKGAYLKPESLKGFSYPSKNPLGFFDGDFLERKIKISSSRQRHKLRWGMYYLNHKTLPNF